MNYLSIFGVVRSASRLVPLLAVSRTSALLATRYCHAMPEERVVS
jgi:hypothetical protein